MVEASARQYDFVLLDVFTKVRFGGNPLAVFPSSAGLSDQGMQSIAREIDSETVFLLEPTTPQAVARARIFTPLRELDFAGHPTIGAASVIVQHESPRFPFAIEENVGLVRIDGDSDNSGDLLLWLTTPEVSFHEAVDPEFCAKLLGLCPGDICPDVPPQYVSAGSPLLFVCLTSSGKVDHAELQREYLEQALGRVNSVGTFIFARKEPRSASCFDVYSRMFAPQIGFPEDPATGGATGPLAALMLRNELLPRDAQVGFTSEQGTKMGRRSLLHVRVESTKDDVKILVGGSVVMTATGKFFV